MASVVYFKFKSSVKTDSVSFDGSAISVKDLKNAIKNKCCLHSTELDLKLEDNSGKEFAKDSELIPKFTSIIVRRVPKPSNESHKRKPIQASGAKEIKVAHQLDLAHSNITNLADSDLTEEEKIRVMIDRSSEAFSSKNYAVKAKAYGVPPPGYACHKCNQSGHWIHDCPGIKDLRGNLVDSKTVKRPTGIPQDFLVRVDPGTPGAYLDKSGRYMVPIKDAEAYSQKKKEKRAFSLEENPPYVPPQERTPSEGLVCPLCKKLLRDAVLITCCGTSYCNECITNQLFDTGSQKCPNCESPVVKYDSAIIENAAMRRAVMDWLKASGSPDITNSTASPELIQLKSITPEPEKVVRRLLKPKQPAISDFVKAAAQETGSPVQRTSDEMKTPNLEGCDSTSNDTAIRTGNSSEPLCSKTVPFLPKSESSVTLVKSFPIDPQTLPVVSNTSSVANLPCATSFGAGGGASVVPPVPVVTSLYSNTPLVFPSEGSSLANAMYSANLAAGMPAVGAAQAPLATVFSSNSLVSSNSIWQPPDVSFLGSVDQSNLLNSGGVFPSVNPLVDLHNAVGVDKLLSKEEFYRVKRQLMEESSHRSFHRASRTRRSHSRDSQPSRRSGIESRRRAAPDYYSRKRDDDRRSRKRSPPRHRLRSRSSESDHRQTSTKGESLFVEDYDTWRRKKARRQQMEAVAGECRRRLSPFRGTRRRSDSLLSSPLRGDKREASPRGTHVERYRRYAEESDKSRLRSPFPSGSPGRNSLETTSPCCGSNRHQERRCRHEGSDVSRIKSSSKLPSKLSENIIPSVPDPSNEVDLEGLDAKALKKIRKQQKKAKREKKLARRAARAQKSAGLSGGSDKGIYDDLDGISPVMFGDEDNDGEAVANVKREKKKKRKHKFVRRVDSEADSDGDSRRKSKRKRKEKKSKRYHDNVEQRVVGEDMEESLEVC